MQNGQNNIEKLVQTKDFFDTNVVLYLLIKYG